MGWSSSPELESLKPGLGWSDEERFADIGHDVGWVGEKKVSSPVMLAVAVLDAPEIASGVTVRVPAESLTRFPFVFPVVFAARPLMNGDAAMPAPERVIVVEPPHMGATAQALVPDVKMGADHTYEPPTMTATAEMPTPTPSGGVEVYPPVMWARVDKDEFPYRFPIIFGNKGFYPPKVSATKEPHPDPMVASAEMFTPAVASDATVASPAMEASAVMPVPVVSMTPPAVEAPRMGATAEAMGPTVASGATVAPPRMEATAGLFEMTVASGNVVSGVVFEASAAMPAPVVASGVSVDVSRMEADGELLAPFVEASDAPAVEPPPMQAVAAMLPPDVVVGHVAEPPVMAAAAGMPIPAPQMGVTVEVPPMLADADEVSRFPLLFPVVLGRRAGIFTPTIYTWRERVEPPAMGATAAMPAPAVGSGAVVESPVMGASAAMPAPATGSGATVRPPRMGASAAMPTPDYGPLPMSPVAQQFTSAGNHTYNVPSDCLFIDIILLGGGSGGTDGRAAFQRGNGGRAGQWAVATLQRGVHIPWSATQIMITVGAAGTRSGNAGGNTVAVVPDYGTLTANGGSGQVSSQDGESPGSQNFNGVTYVGGNGGTGNGGAGSAPGAAGAGGNGGLLSGSNGGNGAVGRAWLRAYQ